jgi:hypothetical protein
MPDLRLMVLMVRPYAARQHNRNSSAASKALTAKHTKNETAKVATMKYSRISRAESFPLLGRASTFQKMFHITLAVQDANHMNGTPFR